MLRLPISSDGFGNIGLERMIDGRQALASQRGGPSGDNCLPRQQSQRFGHAEGDMPRSYDSLTLEDAKRMLSAAEAKAASLGIAYNIAIVDAGGHGLCTSG